MCKKTYKKYKLYKKILKYNVIPSFFSLYFSLYAPKKTYKAYKLVFVQFEVVFGKLRDALNQVGTERTGTRCSELHKSDGKDA